MKNRKYITLILIMLLLGFMALWVNNIMTSLLKESEDSEENYQYHFAMVAGNTENDYWNQVYEGAKERAMERGTVVEMVGSSLAVQYSLYDRLNMAIAQKPDGIFVCPDGSADMKLLIKEAQQANIPVLTMMENSYQLDNLGYVGIDSYEQGRAYGRLIAETLSKKKNLKVMMLTSARPGNMNGTTAWRLYRTICEYIRENGLLSEVEVSAKHINEASIFNSKRDVQIILGKNEPPDVLICTDYRITLSTCQSVLEQKKAGEVIIFGSYVDRDILNYIRDGVMYGTVTTDPHELGVGCVDALLAVKADKSRKNEHYLDIKTITAADVPDVTEENNF